MPGIGEILRDGRECSGLSREEMARTLRVPLSTVEALEDERWEQLPPPVYVRGFVTSWCRVAGIDASPARDALLRSLGPAAPRELPLPDVRRATGITVGVRPSSRRSGRRLTIAGTVLLLLALSGFATIYVTGRQGRDSDVPAAQPVPAAQAGYGLSEPDAGFSSEPANIFGE